MRRFDILDDRHCFRSLECFCTLTHERKENKQKQVAAHSAPPVQSPAAHSAPPVPSPAPQELLVKTMFGNTTGLYRPSGECQGFKAYVHSTGKPFIYKLFGQHWAIGDELGSGSAFHVVKESPASTPAEAKWEDGITVKPLVAVDTSKAPKMLRVKSPYPSLDGGYDRRETDYDGYPVYDNAEDGKVLWHGRTEQMWLLSDKEGNPQAFCTAESDEVNAAKVPKTLWSSQPFSVVEITWDGVSPDDKGFFDHKFPADPSSTGLDPPREIPAQWIRAPQMTRLAEDKLFDEIHPNDCMQGGVGNCWLIAAIASIAEFPSAIERLIEPKKIAPDGKYTISLYDVRTSSWAPQVMDDLIPCEPFEVWQENATPVFSKPDGNELWVLLLEKAFAKFVGSYGELSGGQTSWAWQALTGVEEQVWYFRDAAAQVWKKCVVKPDQQREMMRTDRRACPFFPTDYARTDAEFFTRLHEWDQANYVMSACITPKPGEIEAARNDGLVEGHAYSLIQVKEVGGLKLIQLRNPWGSQEWNGKWSDESAEWSAHPEVAQALDHSADPDGLFWMSYTDFLTVFGNVYSSKSAMASKKGGQQKKKLKGGSKATGDGKPVANVPR